MSGRYYFICQRLLPKKRPPHSSTPRYHAIPTHQRQPDVLLRRPLLKVPTPKSSLVQIYSTRRSLLRSLKVIATDNRITLKLIQGLVICLAQDNPEWIVVNGLRYLWTTGVHFFFCIVG